MLFSNEGLVVVFLIGLLAGWAVGNIVQVSGVGIAGDLIVGVVGAFVGHWILPQMHGHGLLSLVADATVGAAIFILAFRLISLTRIWRERARDEVSRGFERRWRTPIA